MYLALAKFLFSKKHLMKSKKVLMTFFNHLGRIPIFLAIIPGILIVVVAIAFFVIKKIRPSSENLEDKYHNPEAAPDIITPEDSE